MKKFYLIFILTCFYAILLDCIAKESVVYEYDAAGNRTARYIVTEDSDEQPGALRGAFAESDDITKSESVVTLGDLSVEVYPNPTNGPVAIDIKGDTDQPMNVEVFSNVGSSLMSKAVEIGRNMIDLSSYSDGQYIVVVTLGADKSTSFKVIKGN